MECVAVGEIFQRAGEEGYVMLEADLFAGFDEVLFADVAEIGVVEDQIAELRALLDEVDGGEALDLVIKTVETDQLAEDDARVVEAEGLVEIAG